MTSLLCDFGLRGKRNKRFHGEREREIMGSAKWCLGERERTVWNVGLKTENYYLKIFIKIYVNKKMY